MLRNVQFNGLTTGNDVRYLNSWRWDHQVKVKISDFAFKNIYTSSRGVPTEVAALYDSQTFERIYTQVLTGGDNEFGFDQATAYGKSGATFGPTIIYTPIITFSSLAIGTLGTLVGTVNYEFAALYAVPG